MKIIIEQKRGCLCTPGTPIDPLVVPLMYVEVAGVLLCSMDCFAVNTKIHSWTSAKINLG